MTWFQCYVIQCRCMSDEQSLSPTGAANLPTCAHCGDPITPGDACPGRASYHATCHTAKDRAWRTSPEGLRRRREILASYRDRHPDRIAARNAVHAAVQRGELPPPWACPCVSCGNTAAHWDHYLGYSPEHHLDVQPLCEDCHYERRRLRREHRGQEPDRNLEGFVRPEIVADVVAIKAAYARAHATAQERRDAFGAWVREQRDLERAAAARHHGPGSNLQ
jgi:hypothetical protein